MPIRDEEIVHINEEEKAKGKKDMKLPDFFLGHTKEQANQVLRDYKHDVDWWASRAATLTRLDKNDLIQEGYIGLARAVRDFEENRGAAFRTLAIYKIKDSIREYVATQGKNVIIPRYVQETIKFATILRDLTSKAIGENISPFVPMTEVWEMAKRVKVEGGLMKDIMDTIAGLRNLAARSNTSALNLIERAELMPTKMVDIEENMSVNEIHVEDDVVEKLNVASTVEHIRNILSPEDFELLYDRHIDGMTIEEVGQKIGITAESVSVREQKLLAKLRKYEDKILAHEVVAGFKGTGQRRKRGVPSGTICARFGKAQEAALAD
jgi:RNA polymerase sigma factor (sigma-70 family)